MSKFRSCLALSLIHSYTHSLTHSLRIQLAGGNITTESRGRFSLFCGETYFCWRDSKLTFEVFAERGATREESFDRFRAFPALGPIIDAGRKRKRRSVSPEAEGGGGGSGGSNSGHGTKRRMAFWRRLADADGEGFVRQREQHQQGVRGHSPRRLVHL